MRHSMMLSDYGRRGSPGHVWDCADALRAFEGSAVSMGSDMTEWLSNVRLSLIGR